MKNIDNFKIYLQCIKRKKLNIKLPHLVTTLNLQYYENETFVSFR